jgi:hypothetical protein
VLEGVCRLPNSRCHGWPQLWLPRAQQLAAPSTTCEHAKFEGNHWQACQALRAERALAVRGQRPRSGPHKRRNTTVASPAQLSGVATGHKTSGVTCLLQGCWEGSQVESLAQSYKLDLVYSVARDDMQLLSMQAAFACDSVLKMLQYCRTPSFVS